MGASPLDRNGGLPSPKLSDEPPPPSQFLYPSLDTSLRSVTDDLGRRRRRAEAVHPLRGDDVIDDVTAVARRRRRRLLAGNQGPVDGLYLVSAVEWTVQLDDELREWSDVTVRWWPVYVITTTITPIIIIIIMYEALLPNNGWISTRLTSPRQTDTAKTVFRSRLKTHLFSS